MATQTYKARIKIGNGGGSQEVTVQADTTYNAKKMLEAQYGKGSIIFGPVRV